MTKANDIEKMSKADLIKLVKSQKAKNMTTVQKPKAVQGQPIEILESAIKEKSEKRFFPNSFEICPNSEGGAQIFGSTYVGGKGGFRGKLNCYIPNVKAFAEAILKAPHKARTDV